MLRGMRMFLIGENGERLPYTKPSTAGPGRFRNESEREAHRQEISKHIERRKAEEAANPRARKIDSVLDSKRDRKPIYVNLPRRNGKRSAYQINQGKGR